MTRRTVIRVINDFPILTTEAKYVLETIDIYDSHKRKAPIVNVYIDCMYNLLSKNYMLKRKAQSL